MKEGLALNGERMFLDPERLSSPFTALFHLKDLYIYLSKRRTTEYDQFKYGSPVSMDVDKLAVIQSMVHRFVCTIGTKHRQGDEKMSKVIEIDS